MAIAGHDELRQPYTQWLAQSLHQSNEACGASGPMDSLLTAAEPYMSLSVFI